MNKGEIVLYQPDNSSKLEVRLEYETIWLNQKLMSALFDCSTDNVSLHLKNIFKENELNEKSVTEDFSVTASDGKNYKTKHYNLDAIIAVGYRVNSKRATAFRQWATGILKEYVLRGCVVDKRFQHLESRVTETEKKIDFFVKTALPPVQGVFFKGQIFDAYVFVSDLIKSAKKSIILIDNHVDESVLVMLSNRKPKVIVQIYTWEISEKLKLCLKKHSEQYEPITMGELKTVHDRFLIIDDTVYHIGASFKDLGKKLFAFSKMEMKPAELLKGI